MKSNIFSGTLLNSVFLGLLSVHENNTSSNDCIFIEPLNPSILKLP